MKPEEIQKRLRAAEELLSTTTTSKSKFDSIRALISGINPRLDKKLAELSTMISQIEKLGSGDILELGLEAIPTYTEKDKKRKKLLLLYFNMWKDLKAEVKRVENELSQPNQTAKPQTNPLSKIASLAKGPLGLVTVLAVGIVFINSQAAQIQIKNNGCEMMDPRISLPFPIAGIKLPDKPIPDGREGIASLPPLTLNVDGTISGRLKLTVLGISMTFDMPASGMSVLWDGKELLGTRTETSLTARSEHMLVISCL